MCFQAILLSHRSRIWGDALPDTHTEPCLSYTSPSPTAASTSLQHPSASLCYLQPLHQGASRFYLPCTGRLGCIPHQLSCWSPKPPFIPRGMWEQTYPSQLEARRASPARRHQLSPPASRGAVSAAGGTQPSTHIWANTTSPGGENSK